MRPIDAKEPDRSEMPVRPSEDAEAALPVGLPARRRGLVARIDAFVSKLSTRNNFWHRLCSLIWLPYAFKSGITMRKLDSTTFTAVLPFRRFNRNWYNAMAGAALLANSEIAGGMFLFEKCGGDYTVVCKNLNYRFLRPCFGPAVYRVECSEDIRALAEAHQEFNADIELGIFQHVKKRGREVRVGRCDVTFHCTPKSHHHEKKRRRSAKTKSNR